MVDVEVSQDDKTLSCILFCSRSYCFNSQPRLPTRFTTTVRSFRSGIPNQISEAVAIRGNRFIAVGSNADVLKTAGPETKRIDLRGRTVLPGLIDSHTHPISAALSELDAPLPPFNSIADIQNYIRRHAARSGKDQVILVPKVFAPRLRERRYPTRYELDAAASDRPVMADNGYAGVANSFCSTS